MNKPKLKDWIILETVFLIYSASSVVSKIASGYPAMSVRFIGFYILDVAILGIYALLWQQVIKKFELSIAYSNKAVTLLWALVWSVLLFKDKIKITHVIGVVIIIAGIYILNSGKDGERSDEE